MNNIDPQLLSFLQFNSILAPPWARFDGNSNQSLPPGTMDKAWKGFLEYQQSQQKTGTSTQGLKPQDAGVDMGTDEAKNAQAKIQDIMGSYDPEDDDADEKAEKIAGDPELCKYLTRDQRAELVKGLFDGSTGEDEEDAAMVIIRTASPDDLKWVVDSVGWDDLEDELDDGDLDEINSLLARPSLAESGEVFDEVGISDADMDPKDGLEWSEFEHRVQDKLNSLSPDEVQKHARPPGGAQKRYAERNCRPAAGGTRRTKAHYLKRIVELLADKTSDPAAKSRLQQLAFEIQYTRDVSENLPDGDYAQLLNFLPTLADPNASVEERTGRAFRDSAPAGRRIARNGNDGGRNGNAQSKGADAAVHEYLRRFHELV